MHLPTEKINLQIFLCLVVKENIRILIVIRLKIGEKLWIMNLDGLPAITFLQY